MTPAHPGGRILRDMLVQSAGRRNAEQSAVQRSTQLCFLRLERSIPPIDHVTFIDPEDLDAAMRAIRYAALEMQAATDGCYYRGYETSPVPWCTAAAGLAWVRAAKQFLWREYRHIRQAEREKRIRGVSRLGHLLEIADRLGIRFYVHFHDGPPPPVWSAGLAGLLQAELRIRPRDRRVRSLGAGCGFPRTPAPSGQL